MLLAGQSVGSASVVLSTPRLPGAPAPPTRRVAVSLLLGTDFDRPTHPVGPVVGQSAGSISQPSLVFMHSCRGLGPDADRSLLLKPPTLWGAKERPITLPKFRNKTKLPVGVQDPHGWVLGPRTTIFGPPSACFPPAVRSCGPKRGEIGPGPDRPATGTNEHRNRAATSTEIPLNSKRPVGVFFWPG